MKVSTRGRYALRVMIDLAQNQDSGFISLKDIAERQGVSMKYLESIVAMLNKAGLVDSYRGKKGGYRLNQPIENYTIGSIIKLTEGSLAPVSCLETGADHVNCDKAAECITLPMWQKLDKIIDDYLESVSLTDLLKRGNV
jgi:Rrf2 family protein